MTDQPGAPAAKPRRSRTPECVWVIGYGVNPPHMGFLTEVEATQACDLINGGQTDDVGESNVYIAKVPLWKRK